MRRTERATAFGKAFGGILGEGRLSDAVVLGLSAVALQAAALDRPISRLAPAEEAQLQAAADAEGDSPSAALRRRGPGSANPPLWCAPAPAAGSAFPRLRPGPGIAAAPEAAAHPIPVLDALHPLRGPPHRPS